MVEWWLRKGVNEKTRRALVGKEASRYAKECPSSGVVIGESLSVWLGSMGVSIHGSKGVKIAAVIADRSMGDRWKGTSMGRFGLRFKVEGPREQDTASYHGKQYQRSRRNRVRGDTECLLVGAGSQPYHVRR